MSNKLKKLSIGSAQFGLNYGVVNKYQKVSEKEVSNIISVAKKNGLEKIDTAMSYGEAEKVLGMHDLTNFFVTTKLPKLLDSPASLDTWFNTNIENSLKNLNIKKLDAILIHNSSDLMGPNGQMLYKLLVNAKKNNLTNLIGCSIYDPEELKAILNKFEIDVIQAPLNIFDQRLVTSGYLDILVKKKVNIQIRSVFLQGILLSNANGIPSYFNKWKTKFESWDKMSLNSGHSKLALLINFALSFPEVSSIIVGVNSSNQLQQIIIAASENVDYFKELSHFESNDINLINPTHWKLT